MSEKFKRCLAFVLEREGGYSNDPSDRGGRTFKGISERAHPDAWKDGPPSDAAVESIYREHYWNAIHGDSLPEPIALAVMDFAVHSGPRTAWRYLTTICDLQKDAKIADVLARISHAPDPRVVALSLVAERASFLVRRALLTPGQDKFAKGWIVRMVELKRAVEAVPLGG